MRPNQDEVYTGGMLASIRDSWEETILGRFEAILVRAQFYWLSVWFI